METSRVPAPTRVYRARRPTTASWDVLELIARVVDHIPEPSQQMTRYWGWYANAARGKRRKVEEEEPTSTRPSPEDPVDTFTRQARLSYFATARAIRRSLKLPAQEPEPLAHGPPLELELLDQIA